MSKTIIKVSIVDQAASLVTRPVVASGGINESVFQCFFDQSWDGFVKTAVFNAEWLSDPVGIVMINDEAIIPQEISLHDGKFMFGVVGHGDFTKTSEMIEFEIVDGAMLTSDVVVPPSPSLYNQILNVAQNAVDEAQKVRDEFESGVVPAFRDYNNGAAVRVWTGTLNEYNANKDSFPDGVLAIVDDVECEYLVSKSDYIIKYSGGTAEAFYRYTIRDLDIETKSGSMYKSRQVKIPFPNTITSKPISCAMQIISTENDDDIVLIAMSGNWSETETQKICFLSDSPKTDITLKVELRALFKWQQE